MKTTGRRLHSVRQDWVREKIRYDGHNRYEVLDDQGCFLTRKGSQRAIYPADQSEISTLSRHNSGVP